MDDLLIISKTHWQLRRAITTMKQWFEMAALEQHPDKTYSGRVVHGFDWLGYQFCKTGIASVSPRTQQQSQ